MVGLTKRKGNYVFYVSSLGDSLAGCTTNSSFSQVEFWVSYLSDNKKRDAVQMVLYMSLKFRREARSGVFYLGIFCLVDVL